MEYLVEGFGAKTGLPCLIVIDCPRLECGIVICNCKDSSTLCGSYCGSWFCLCRGIGARMEPYIKL
ncbi:hypothetical protein EV203_11274 [Caldanaerobacter subterraneus]|uniref:Uncharacterized protein n=1 Tax=Caldanaerobacter subterraneus TaxID=911092 RepID=A0A4R2JYC6_9THEO|nr:hypothetical protein EV203_11274 [Caldanaerobacter subterraneus]